MSELAQWSLQRPSSTLVAKQIQQHELIKIKSQLLGQPPKEEWKKLLQGQSDVTQ